MTRDVYAGDESPSASEVSDPPQTTRISIRADAQPDVLFRVAAILNLLNAAPEELLMRRESGDVVRIEVLMPNCSEVIFDMVHRKLAQLTCVLNVEREPK
jgi:hypothetical protein